MDRFQWLWLVSGGCGSFLVVPHFSKYARTNPHSWSSRLIVICVSYAFYNKMRKKMRKMMRKIASVRKMMRKISVMRKMMRKTMRKIVFMSKMMRKIVFMRKMMRKMKISSSESEYSRSE